MSTQTNKQLIEEYDRVLESKRAFDQKIQELTVGKLHNDSTSSSTTSSATKINRLWEDVAHSTVCAIYTPIHSDYLKNLVLVDDLTEKPINLDYPEWKDSKDRTVRVRDIPVPDDTKVIQELIDKHLADIKKSLFGCDTKVDTELKVKLDRVTLVLKGGVYVPSDKDSILVSMPTQSSGGKFQLPNDCTFHDPDAEEWDGSDSDDDYMCPLDRRDGFEGGNMLMAYRAPMDFKFDPVTHGFRIILSFDIVHNATAITGADDVPKRRYGSSIVCEWTTIRKVIFTDEAKLSGGVKNKITKLGEKISNYVGRRKTIGVILKHKYSIDDTIISGDTASGSDVLGPKTLPLSDVDSLLYKQLQLLTSPSESKSTSTDTSRDIARVDLVTVIVRDNDVIHSSGPWKEKVRFIHSSSFIREGDMDLVSALIIHPSPPESSDEPCTEK